jgi:hypothetical protein
MAMPVVQRKYPHTRFHSFERKGNGKIFHSLRILPYFIFLHVPQIARSSTTLSFQRRNRIVFASYYNYGPSADDELKSVVRPSCLASFFSHPPLRVILQ